jgi:DNA-binding NtrC family response regulator
MKEIFDLAAELAPSRLAVLLEGESGTGKQHLARELHRRSAFAAGPFVVVPGEGADGAARGEEAGRRDLAAAEGGTLYLEELAAMPPCRLSALLRAQDDAALGRGRRPGAGPAAGRRPAAQILAATRMDLATLVATGRFREDVYHRLAWLPLRIPPLRARPEDVALLADHFLARIAWREQRPLRLDDGAHAALRARAFPGNVRELEQIMTFAARSAGGPVVGAGDLPVEREQPLSLRAAARRGEAELGLRIGAALARTHHDIAAAAVLLGVHRTTLYRWCRQLRGA